MDFTKLLIKPNYNHFAPADVLFFQNSHNKAMRLQSSKLHKEFSDNNYIGTDPHGDLYYDEERHLEGRSYYLVRKEKFIYQGKEVTCAHVIFYQTDAKNPYAEFVAEDEFKIISQMNMDGYSCSGEWKDVKVTDAAGTVERASGNAVVTLTLDGDDLKATINLHDNPNVLLKLDTINVPGTLSFKQRHELKNANCAGWNQDRIVYYNNKNSQDWLGYFMPAAKHTGALGSATGMGEFQGVKWESM